MVYEKKSCDHTTTTLPSLFLLHLWPHNHNVTVFISITSVTTQPQRCRLYFYHICDHTTTTTIDFLIGMEYLTRLKFGFRLICKVDTNP